MRAALILTVGLSAFAAIAEDIVIADFEGDNFGEWVVTGNAFGSGPAHGALRGQLPVNGYSGRGFANSFHGGDRATGTLTSPEFKIERKYITFFIGGGNYGGTCIRLLVGGKVVGTVSGANNEALTPSCWYVNELIGESAQIQIADRAVGGWGHVSVDQIVQSDTPLGKAFETESPDNSPATPGITGNSPQRGPPTKRRVVRVARVKHPVPAPPVAPAAPTALPTTAAIAPGTPAKLRLDEFSHALDVQLVDKLGASRLFSIVEDKDLKVALLSSATVPASATPARRKLGIASVDAVPTLTARYGLPAQPPIDIYDLKNPKNPERFEHAGINFLLITTVEDVEENHIDGATVTRDLEYVNGHQSGWWVQDTEITVGEDGAKIHHSGARSGGSSWKRETVHVGPMTQKEQSLRVTLRNRLFDTKTGELLGSRTKNYARGRTYMASARGNNEVSMGDLYQAAAEDLADWERNLVEDDAFPVKVLKIDNDMVLINRGDETGVRRNAYYDVWMLGAEIKDPDTNEVLGREEIKTGKVLILELQPKFSRAKISDNNGIKIGNILRPAR